MVVAIVFSLDTEIKPLLGRFQNSNLLFHRTGIGMHHAHEATEELVHCHKPQLILSVGFAGAAKADLKTGDLILATEIRSESLKDRFLTASEETNRMEQELRRAGIPFHKGPLKTLWKMGVATAKAQAHQEGALAVDMETAAIAAIAQKACVPLVSLRVIFDTMVEDLSFKESFDEQHPWQFLFQNPGVILKIPRYARMNCVARRNLCRAMTSFLNGRIKA